MPPGPCAERHAPSSTGGRRHASEIPFGTKGRGFRGRSSCGRLVTSLERAGRGSGGGCRGRGASGEHAGSCREDVPCHFEEWRGCAGVVRGQWVRWWWWWTLRLDRTTEECQDVDSYVSMILEKARIWTAPARSLPIASCVALAAPIHATGLGQATRQPVCVETPPYHRHGPSTPGCIAAYRRVHRLRLPAPMLHDRAAARR